MSDRRGGVLRIHRDGTQNLIGGSGLTGDPSVSPTSVLRSSGLLPNGIAMQRDGAFLVANLGEQGGVWRIAPDGAASPWLMEVNGRAVRRRLCDRGVDFYIMDRGYLDFTRLYEMHQRGVFFVTRAKSNFNARRVYSAKADKATGVVCDQAVALNGHQSARDYPEHFRRVRFKDPKASKTLIFLTNNTTLPAPVIAQLYKNRWQVVLFFKWIKQHLRIKKFLGTSENAIKTQVWCAIATYVLIAIVKKELQLNSSLYTCLQILSVSVFEKTLISCALQTDDYKTQAPSDDHQLILFGF